MKKKKTSNEYLSSFLKVSPLSHALWRATEALSFDRVNFKAPVLDLGCGFGEFAGIVFDQMEMGIDINKKELGQALAGKRYRNVKWADARNLPFGNQSYETVVSVSVMEHIDKAHLVVKDVNRVLKKNGLFIFSVPTPALYEGLLIPQILELLNLKKLAKRYFELHCQAFKHVWLRDAIWWRKVLKKNGFEVICEEGTISSRLVKLHELFLLTALPSQLWKLLFGRRLVVSVGLRSKILPPFFSWFVKTDPTSNYNMFFVAKKVRFLK